MAREMSDRPAETGHHFITPSYRFGFYLIVSLFFLWALANNFNDILIRQFQKSLGLDRAQAGFIQFVFYIGYFVVALPAGLLMRRFGYKAGVLTGLLLYATGALMFLPASLMLSFGMFLFALFMIAAGAACLETTANAYTSYFGSPGGAVRRLNLAQAFNGLGACLAPTLGGLLIFSGVEHSTATIDAMDASSLAAYRASEATTVQLPYALLALAALVVAGAVAFTRLPVVEADEDATLRDQFQRLLRHRPLVGAVIAQFFYVGAQVGIWSYFIDFVKDVTPSVSEKNAAFLLSASLILFMIGRFSGAAIMTRIRPSRLLFGYALANVVLCGVAAFASPWIAVGALALSSFFMSIMFPTIFALGIEGVGPAKPLGSSCIIMAIIGGAIFPPIMGFIAVKAGAVPIAMLLPLMCFIVIAAYAHRASIKRDVVPPAATAHAFR
jgi:FHS family L-fucose permease-like MFS transporter